MADRRDAHREPDLMQRVYEPEDDQEREHSAQQREERRWLEDRPPHYEPR